MRFEHTYHLTDLPKEPAEAEAAKATEAPTAAEATEPKEAVILQFPKRETPSEPAVETAESALNLSNPLISKMSEGKHPETLAEEGMRLMNTASENIVTATKNVSEFIGRLAGSSAEAAGKTYASLKERWDAGVESVNQEKSMGAESLNAKEALVQREVANSTAITEAARKLVEDLVRDVTAKALEESRTKIQEGMDVSLNAGKENFSLGKWLMKGVPGWLKGMWSNLRKHSLQNKIDKATINESTQQAKANIENRKLQEKKDRKEGLIARMKKLESGAATAPISASAETPKTTAKVENTEGAVPVAAEAASEVKESGNPALDQFLKPETAIPTAANDNFELPQSGVQQEAA